MSEFLMDHSKRPAKGAAGINSLSRLVEVISCRLHFSPGLLWKKPLTLPIRHRSCHVCFLGCTLGPIVRPGFA